MNQNPTFNSNQPNSQENLYGQPVSVYTSQEALEDGVLFDITAINPAWARGLFNNVTTNLLGRGYMDDKGKINIPNLLDLLNQVNQIVRRESKNFTEFDHFFSGSIELPDGGQQMIFICCNETGKFTLMMPEDY